MAGLMRHPFGETVTIVRKSPGGVDTYGDPITSTLTRIDVANCAVAPRYSTEPSERGRNGVVVGKTVYPPYGAGILFTDQLEIGGVLYDIDGEPTDWKNPLNGVTPGGEVAVKRAQG